MAITHDHAHTFTAKGRSRFDILAPLRQWLNGINVDHPKLAHVLCQLIPCHCVFERDIALFGRTYHIPALCKLNPVYDELIGLRFRALTYLVDICGEDVTKYC